MTRYITLRLAAMVPVLIGASMFSFALAKLAPGDVTTVLLGPYASEADRQSLRRELALDRPAYIQYAHWLGRALHGDLGRSIQMRAPVAQVLVEKFKNTLILGSTSFLLAFGVGLLLGIIAAAKPRTSVDRAIQVLTTFLATMPVFWVGLVLIYVFSVSLGLLPTGRMGPVAGGGDFLTTMKHLILPTVTTAAIPAAIIAKSTRSAILELTREEYVTAARAKGLSEFTLLRRHILKAAAPPILYVSGLQFAYLIGGTVVFSEIVFSWPGTGLQIFNAVGSRDIPMIQSIVLLAALVSVVINLLVDVLHVVLDPRVVVARA